jgi:hypothetical protein
MSTSTITITLDLTGAQLAGLKAALLCRTDHCKDMVNALVSTNNGKTAIADHWRTQLATAEQLLAIVQRAA